MPDFFKRLILGIRRTRRRVQEIAPDEILLDSTNIPRYDTAQMEGRLEKPISRAALYSVGGMFAVVAIVFVAQAWNLQIAKGEEYRERSERNMLRPIPIFAGRGVITDRNGTLLAWNAPYDLDATSDEIADGSAAKAFSPEDSVARRQYATSTGLSHVLGYVQYPSKDKNGFYYQNDFEGVAGAEKYFQSALQGVNGSRLVEIDARNNIVSQNVVRPAEQGKEVKLSIDARLQSTLFENIKSVADSVGFAGGAGIIMDVRTGEIIALTSYPEYSSQVMSDRKDAEAVRALLNDKNLPFLNRAVDGLYTPGSVVKPFVALGALNEGIIAADTNIHTTGSISIPNPYDSTKATVFRDWKNHGTVNMRSAIAVSSDVYFYIIGGGFKDQKGLGIQKIDKYLKMFGFGELMPESFAQGKAGTIPTPEWKKETFDEDWYLGNTYHTAIGQYGFQVTPIQMVRAIAAIANGGKLLVPSIAAGSEPSVEKDLSDEISQNYFKVVREGMRMGAIDGTAKALNVPYVEVAAKTGTAELGVSKDMVNSWVTGFWPYQEPKYAFVVMMEKGSVHNLIGAAAVMRQQLDWMNQHAKEYFR